MSPHIRILALLVLCVGSLAATNAEAQDDGDGCDLQPNPNGCTAPNYSVISIENQISEDECEQGFRLKEYCILEQDPPTPTALFCNFKNGAFLCEAWPQGLGLTYRWTSTLRMGSGKLENPFRGVFCDNATGGLVEVAVISPTSFHAEAKTSVTVSCPAN